MSLPSSVFPRKRCFLKPESYRCKMYSCDLLVLIALYSLHWLQVSVKLHTVCKTLIHGILDVCTCPEYEIVVCNRPRLHNSAIMNIFKMASHPSPFLRLVLQGFKGHTLQSVRVEGEPVDKATIHGIHDLIIIKMLRKKGKATQHNRKTNQRNITRPRQVFFKEKNCLGWDSNPRPSAC